MTAGQWESKARFIARDPTSLRALARRHYAPIPHACQGERQNGLVCSRVSLSTTTPRLRSSIIGASRECILHLLRRLPSRSLRRPTSLAQDCHSTLPYSTHRASRFHPQAPHFPLLFHRFLVYPSPRATKAYIRALRRGAGPPESSIPIGWAILVPSMFVFMQGISRRISCMKIGLRNKVLKGKRLLLFLG